MNCNKHTKCFIFHDHLTKYVITYISYETKNKKWKKRNILIIDTHCERKKL